MYQNIMVPLDGSKVAECVLPHVEVLIGLEKVKEVTFIRVVTPLHMHGGLETRFLPEERKRLDKDAIDIAKSYLDQVAGRLKDKGIAVRTEILFGKVEDELEKYANEHKVDLIILSSHGHSGITHGITHWGWGSTADRILKRTNAPIFLVRACDVNPASKK